MDFLLSIAHGINLLVMYLTNHKEVISVVVGGAGIVSFSLEPLKKWLSVQSHNMITVLHYLLALVAVGVHYVATSNSHSPTILFAQALILLGTNQFVYPLVTKPVVSLLSDAKAQRNVQAAVKEAEQLTNKTSTVFNG